MTRPPAGQPRLAYGPPILPLERLETLVPGLSSGLEQRQPGWVEVGWGDKGFYQASEITVALAARAFFASSGAVLHVVRPEQAERPDGQAENPWTYFSGSQVVELRINQQELDSVCRFVPLSFQREPENEAGAGSIPLGKGLYGDSRFYQAIGHYHALHTCNTWTAKGLASAGLDLRPQGILTTRDVMGAARQSARAVRHAGFAPTSPVGGSADGRP